MAAAQSPGMQPIKNSALADVVGGRSPWCSLARGGWTPKRKFHVPGGQTWRMQNDCSASVLDFLDHAGK